MQTATLKNFDENLIDDEINRILSLDAEIESLKKQRDKAEGSLLEYVKADISSGLADKDYGAGTVNLESLEYKIKAVVSKRVKWDQDKLAEIYQRIQEHGENPAQYVKVKYDVSENAYKNWPDAIAKAFEPARTVEVTAPKFSFERKE